MLPRHLHPNMARIRALFAQGLRLSQHDIDARVFIATRNAREYLKLLHQLGEIYVCDYRRDGMTGPATPIYALRTDPEQQDAPRPVPLSKAELQRRRREKTEARAKDARAKRVKRAAEKFSRKGGILPTDPVLATFFRDATIQA